MTTGGGSVIDFGGDIDAIWAGTRIEETIDSNRGRQFARLAMATVRHAGVPNEHSRLPEGLVSRLVYLDDIGIGYCRMDLIGTITKFRAIHLRCL